MTCHCCTEPAYPATMLNWNCPDCRARMLAACPDKITRQRWLARWRDQGEDAMADAVLARLRAMSAMEGKQ